MPATAQLKRSLQDLVVTLKTSQHMVSATYLSSHMLHFVSLFMLNGFAHACRTVTVPEYL